MTRLAYLALSVLLLAGSRYDGRPSVGRAT
jgi:hypothetical protein